MGVVINVRYESRISACVRSRRFNACYVLPLFTVTGLSGFNVLLLIISGGYDKCKIRASMSECARSKRFNYALLCNLIAFELSLFLSCQ